MKSTACKEVTINKTVFKRDDELLNIGSQMIRLGTVKKQLVYKITAQLTAGDTQKAQVKTVETVLRSIVIR